MFGIRKKKQQEKIEYGLEQTKGSKNENQDHLKKDEMGSFLAFVLLSSKSWDKALFLKQLVDEWGIEENITEKNTTEVETETKEYEDIVYIDVEELHLAVSFIPAAIPNQEAQHFAKANYMWPNAAEVVQKHQAQILIAVLGDNKFNVEKGILLNKAVMSALAQRNAVAVYSDGAVYEPGFYLESKEILKDYELPILNLVWFGIYQTNEKIGIYTYGMQKFGKEEMEVYVEKETSKLNELRAFVFDMVSYVLIQNITLHDGETIGFSEDQKLPITRSQGIALDGMTIKIKYITQ